MEPEEDLRGGHVNCLFKGRSSPGSGLVFISWVVGQEVGRKLRGLGLTRVP